MANIAIAQGTKITFKDGLLGNVVQEIDLQFDNLFTADGPNFITAFTVNTKYIILTGSASINKIYFYNRATGGIELSVTTPTGAQSGAPSGVAFRAGYDDQWYLYHTYEYKIYEREGWFTPISDFQIPELADIQGMDCYGGETFLFCYGSSDYIGKYNRTLDTYEQLHPEIPNNLNLSYSATPYENDILVSRFGQDGYQIDRITYTVNGWSIVESLFLENPLYPVYVCSEDPIRYQSEPLFEPHLTDTINFTDEAGQKVGVADTIILTELVGLVIDIAIYENIYLVEGDLGISIKHPRLTDTIALSEVLEHEGFIIASVSDSISFNDGTSYANSSSSTVRYVYRTSNNEDYIIRFNMDALILYGPLFFPPYEDKLKAFKADNTSFEATGAIDYDNYYGLIPPEEGHHYDYAVVSFAGINPADHIVRIEISGQPYHILDIQPWVAHGSFDVLDTEPPLTTHNETFTEYLYFTETVTTSIKKLGPKVNDTIYLSERTNNISARLTDIIRILESFRLNGTNRTSKAEFIRLIDLARHNQPRGSASDIITLHEVLRSNIKPVKVSDIILFTDLAKAWSLTQYTQDIINFAESYNKTGPNYLATTDIITLNENYHPSIIYGVASDTIAIVETVEAFTTDVNDVINFSESVRILDAVYNKDLEDTINLVDRGSRTFLNTRTDTINCVDGTIQGIPETIILSETVDAVKSKLCKDVINFTEQVSAGQVKILVVTDSFQFKDGGISFVWNRYLSTYHPYIGEVV